LLARDVVKNPFRTLFEPWPAAVVVEVKQQSGADGVGVDHERLAGLGAGVVVDPGVVSRLLVVQVFEHERKRGVGDRHVAFVSSCSGQQCP